MPTRSVKRVLKVPSDEQPTAKQTSVTLPPGQPSLPSTQSLETIPKQQNPAPSPGAAITHDGHRPVLRSTRNSSEESNAPRVRCSRSVDMGRERRGGGRHRQAFGGAGGVLHPRG